MLDDINEGLKGLNTLKITHGNLNPYTSYKLGSKFGFINPFLTIHSQISYLTKFPCLSLYMSPEIIKGQEPTIESDYWSLGIILYEYMTGKLLFNTIYQIVVYCTAPYPVPELPPKYSDQIRLYIKNLLLTQPGRRENFKNEEDFTEGMPNNYISVTLLRKLNKHKEDFICL